MWKADEALQEGAL
jgi:hypothetical protein